ncbi:AMP-binding acetyl-CoA synthetase [Gammaproteobacteria bacterium 45_16_T64]|nr:AMP-binding acetyl-CoA synthetase [Gammaproteobacteria bacterium 45_16_T64]
MLGSTLVGQLLRWEQERPNAVYLVQPLPNGELETYTWSEVAGQVKKMAAYLVWLGFPPKSQIAILGKNSAHWIIADLAIMMAGHVSVPLYPSLDSDTANYILDHSESRLLFIGKMDVEGEEWVNYLRALPAEIPKVALPHSPAGLNGPTWGELISINSPIEYLPLPRSEDLTTIIYTSGSTGTPKGVMHNNSSMLAVCHGFQRSFDMSPSDRMLSYLPLAHAAERAIVETASLFYGFTVYFSDCQNTFSQDLRRAKPTVFFSVPRLWLKFYSAVSCQLHPDQTALLESGLSNAEGLRKAVLKQLGLEDTRVALTGSAPISEDIVSWYRALGLEMLDCYGMSENFATSHVSRPGEVRSGYVGSPANGVLARISSSGELEVKSAGQMMGYYKSPEQTHDEMTEDGFFKTGDCGVIDHLGRLKITGRVKDIFKTSKGKYIAPVPIEQRFDNIPGIETVCVMGSGLPSPFLMIALEFQEKQRLIDTSDRVTFEEKLTEKLHRVNQDLQPHEKLAFVVVIGESWSIGNGLLTPTMKIKRSLIENAYQGLAAEWFDLNKTIIWYK